MRITFPRHALAFAVLAFLLSAASSRVHAALVLIDNFNTGVVGTTLNAYNSGWSASTQYTIQADPTNASNRVASLGVGSANNTAATRAFGTANNIANGTTGTIFFRALYPSTVGANFGIYVQDTTTNGATGNRRAGVIFVGNQLNERGIAGDQQVTTPGFSNPPEDRWYRFWLVMDNAADTFQLYAQDEIGGAQTLLGNVSGTTLGFQTGATSNALQAIMLLTSNAGSPTGGFFDDLYVDNTGINLTNPLAAAAPSVPEPASISLLALGGMALLRRSRRCSVLR